ncbi:MAG: hypothetical protein GC168_11540 [Candidatus Hydrogenedens sp.]|nr:hypothetical protein [Candidatus Hydrogenedens sp.]
MRFTTTFLCCLLGTLGATADEPEVRFESHVPIRAITSGPQAHWFGYYDKQQFSPDGRYILGMETGFEGRTPAPDDTIALGMVDTDDNDRWIPLAETRAWSWQQGCMFQWVPGSDTQVIYNDRRDGAFVSVLLDVQSREERVLPAAIYTLHPSGKWGIGLDFARLDHTRPGYGYKGVEDATADVLIPEDSGIYRVDFETGAVTTLVTLAQVAAVPWDVEPQGRHWFNHLLFNPDGSRFIFLHRAQVKPGGQWSTRMFTAAADGSALHVVADAGMVSHFIWHDPAHLLTWSREEDTGNKFHYYTDQTDEVKVIGEDVLTHDGHCTYSPDGQWILTDTYPDKDRMQSLMLYRPSDGTLLPLGKFYLKKPSEAEFRCDLHPRWNRDGTKICIDSMHLGDQRQMYVLEVGKLLANK